ncbi:MAG: DUF1295 domain-containing protein [Chitinophagales bacterium]
MFCSVTYCFVVGELTHNNSQVDKLWSILPIIYALCFAYYAHWEPRVVLMATLVAVWGIRLTYNFSRRGAYSWRFWTGEEDYRWAVLRKDPKLQGRFRWMLFNLLFICAYQNILIWLFTLPLAASMGSDKALGAFDFVLAGLAFLAIGIETIADQQQWNYQKEKYRRIQRGEPLTGIYAGGFVRTGLWSIVRHPNYVMEQLFWVFIFLFSVVATGAIIYWSIAGCILLILLFQGSASFSEGISATKYPAYAEYKKRVGRFIPKMRNR